MKISSVILFALFSLVLSQCQNKPRATGQNCVFDSDCFSRICDSFRCASINLVAENQNCDADYRAFYPLNGGIFLLSKKRQICGAGLECLGYSNILLERLGKCSKMPRNGDACVDNGASCIGGFCANATKVCTPYRSGASGSRCNAASDCQQNLQCLNNQCTAQAKAGESCVDYSSCESGLACENKKCYKLAGNGEACDSKTECQENLFCNSNNNKCAALYSSPEGATCRSNLLVGSVECQSGLACINNKCTRPGSNCTTSGCPGVAQVCECPGNCVGDAQNANVYYNAMTQVSKGNRNFGWAYCQFYRTTPLGYVDQTILNLICTASASSINVSLLLIAGIALLFFGLYY